MSIDTCKEFYKKQLQNHIVFNSNEFRKKVKIEETVPQKESSSSFKMTFSFAEHNIIPSKY